MEQAVRMCATGPQAPAAVPAQGACSRLLWRLQARGGSPVQVQRGVEAQRESVRVCKCEVKRLVSVREQFSAAGAPQPPSPRPTPVSAVLSRCRPQCCPSCLPSPATGCNKMPSPPRSLPTHALGSAPCPQRARTPFCPTLSLPSLEVPQSQAAPHAFAVLRERVRICLRQPQPQPQPAVLPLCWSAFCVPAAPVAPPVLSCRELPTPFFCSGPREADVCPL